MIDPALKRRLGRIASTYNSKARWYRRPGVVSWEMLYRLTEHPCHYCGVNLEPRHGSFDHVVPFAEGGTNEITNIVRCCTTCQRTKFTKSVDEFREHRGMIATCARPGCGNTFRPRWAERQRGMAKFCSHRCAGMARGQGW